MKNNQVFLLCVNILNILTIKILLTSIYIYIYNFLFKSDIIIRGEHIYTIYYICDQLFNIIQNITRNIIQITL